MPDLYADTTGGGASFFKTAHLAPRLLPHLCGVGRPRIKKHLVKPAQTEACARIIDVCRPEGERFSSHK